MPGNPQKPSPLGKVPRRGGRGPHPFRPAPLPRSVWTSNPGDLFSHLLRKCQLPQRGSLIAAGPQTTKSGAASSMSLRGAERRGNPSPQSLPPWGRRMGSISATCRIIRCCLAPAKCKRPVSIMKRCAHVLSGMYSIMSSTRQFRILQNISIVWVLTLSLRFRRVSCPGLTPFL